MSAVVAFFQFHPVRIATKTNMWWMITWRNAIPLRSAAHL